MTDLAKIRWQCRRGMLELDILLERFLNKHFENLTESEKKLFIQLLEQPDPTLYAWLMGYETPDLIYQDIIKKIKP